MCREDGDDDGVRAVSDLLVDGEFMGKVGEMFRQNQIFKNHMGEVLKDYLNK